MINRYIIFIFISSSIFSQTAFPGLDSWTHANSLGLAGGGYIIPSQNEFRNAGSLARPDRLFQLSLIKYPASITAQSIIINGSYNQHYFGLFIKNINYGTFDFRTDDNIKMGTFTAGDTHFKIGYARYVYKDKLVLGTNAGIFLSQIDSYNAKLITASPSILLKGNAISLGVSIEKLGRIFESYTNENIKLHPSFIFSLYKSYTQFPLEAELSFSKNKEMKSNISTFSFLYKLSIKSYVKAGISSNRLNRITGNSFAKNLMNDIGFGFGYDFDDFYIDFNIYSYSNTHSIYGITLASKF